VSEYLPFVVLVVVDWAVEVVAFVELACRPDPLVCPVGWDCGTPSVCEGKVSTSLPDCHGCWGISTAISFPALLGAEVGCGPP